MIKNKTQGFSIIEVAVSITLFTILAPSIYLMISYLIASSNSTNYLDELIYRSYLERQVLSIKKPMESENHENIQLFNRNQKVIVKIQKSPNNRIYLISLKPLNKEFPNLKAYLRVK